MPLKRFIIEMGMGVDQHGQEPTVAAARAVAVVATVAVVVVAASGDISSGRNIW